MFNQSKTVWVAFCAVVVVLGIGHAAKAQESSSCLDGIEKWMRGCQARTIQMQGRTIYWPGCCSNGHAPFYPPDNYYTDALKDNPALTEKLVEACQTEFHAMNLTGGHSYLPLATYFAKMGGHGVTSLNGVKIDEVTVFADDDMSSFGLTVSQSNYCDIFKKLKADLAELKGVTSEIGQVVTGSNDGASTRDTSVSPAICYDQAQCHSDPETAFNLAKSNAQACWTQHGYQGSPSAGSITIDQRADYGTDVYSNTCWNLRVGANAGYLNADLRGFKITGSAKLYVAGTQMCDGATPRLGCVVDPATLDAYNATRFTWREYQTVSIPKRDEPYTSATMAYSEELPLTYSFTDGPNCDHGTNSVAGHRGWILLYTRALVLPDWDNVVADSNTKCGDNCGQCQSGVPKVALGGTGRDGSPDPTANVYWPLGKLDSGHSAGDLQFFDMGIAAGGVIPERIIANMPDLGGSESIVDTVSSVRQFVTATTIADVRALTSGTGIAIKFYHLVSCTAPTTTDTGLTTDLWTFTGASPFAHTEISYSTTGVYDPANPTTTTTVGGAAKYKIEEILPGSHVWEISNVGSDWLLRSGIVSTTPTSLETRIFGSAGGGSSDKTSTRQVLEANGIVAYQEVEQWHQFAWGAEVVKRTIGTTGDGGVLTSTRSFYETAGTGAAVGRLKDETDFHGNWRRYTYDTQGRIATIVSAFGDNAIGTADSSNRVESHAYYVMDVGGGSTADDVVEEIVERIQNVPVTRTYVVQFAGNAYRIPGLEWGQRSWVIRCVDPVPPTSESALNTFLKGVWDTEMGTSSGQGWGKGTDDISETIRRAIDSTDPIGRVVTSLRHDGALTWNVYYDSYSSGVQSSPAWNTGVLSVSGQMDNVSTSPYVTCGTERRTFRNAQGTVMLATTKDLASTFITSQTTTVDTVADPTGVSPYVDEFGRATRMYDVLTGRHSTTVYSCCGIESQTDEQGITTTYDYDALKRVTKVSTQVGPATGSPPTYDALKSITEYDAAGRVKATKRQDTANSTPVIVSSNVYDPAGRLTSSSNFEGAAGTTTYSETYNSTTGLTTRTETLPDPDGTGSGHPLPSPQNVRVYHRDGSLATVNVPFYSSTSASAPEQYAYGVTTSPAGYRYVIRYPTSASIDSSSPYTETFTDPLGRTKWVYHSLTSSSAGIDEYAYSDNDRAVTQTDADGTKTITIRGTGPAQASYQGAAIFGSGGVPSGLTSYFSGQWNLAVKKVDSSTAITVSASSGAADRMSLSGSWFTTKTVSSTSFPVRHSATIVWKDNTSSSSVLETSSSDTQLNGVNSWTTSFGNTTNTISIVGASGGTIDGTTTTTTCDCTGAKTIVKTLFGRQNTIERSDPSSTFISETDIKYDALGRVSQTQLWRTVSHSSNANCDFTDFTYYGDSDRVYQRTDPSPTNGSTTSDRLVTTFTCDHLGRATSVGLPGSKHTDTTYTAAGQVETVRGFGVNPVDHTYDEQGHMQTLTTYKNATAATGAAVTTWDFNTTSGRLSKKYYDGSSSADLVYTYTDAGRLSSRGDARGVTTTYEYDATTRDLSKVSYNDSITPTVLYQNYDRLGRPTRIVDAGGKHDLTYTDEGKLRIDAITADTGISDAPGLNLLAGTTTTDSYDYASGAGCGLLRVGHVATHGSSTVNTVNFEYDSFTRINRVKKSGADVLYTYDPVTGQVATSTNRKDKGSTYTSRFYGTRGYDRLGRLLDIYWTTSTGTNPGMGDRAWTYDSYGRRTNLTAVEIGSPESWEYSYDDKGQLTQAAASFASTSLKIPGSYYAYDYDDIGNRTSVANGSTSDSYSMSYTSNSLNQYTKRDVSRNIEISGYSPAATVQVIDPNGTNTTDRFKDSSGNLLYDGFYHTRLTESGSDPQKVPVQVDEIPTGVSTNHTVFLSADSEGFTYDASGNMTADSVWDYTYDGENRLVAMQLSESLGGQLLKADDLWVRLEFAYDYMGRRISKRLYRTEDNLTETDIGKAKVEWGQSYWQKFVYDTGSWNLSAILNCDPETGAYNEPEQTFAWGPDLSTTEQGAGGIGGLAIYYDDYYDLHNSSTANGPMFPTYDGNGNIIALYDASAADITGLPTKKAEYHYGPFGEERGRWGPVEASRFPFRWSTKYTDNETGLVYYGVRFYSASLGRWVTRDPAGESVQLSRYAFVGNEPTNAVDSIGYQLYKPHLRSSPSNKNSGRVSDTLTYDKSENDWWSYTHTFDAFAEWNATDDGLQVRGGAHYKNLRRTKTIVPPFFTWLYIDSFDVWGSVDVGLVVDQSWRIECTSSGDVLVLENEGHPQVTSSGLSVGIAWSSKDEGSVGRLSASVTGAYKKSGNPVKFSRSGGKGSVEVGVEPQTDLSVTVTVGAFRWECGCDAENKSNK